MSRSASTATETEQRAADRETMSMVQAINSALHCTMAADPAVLVMGEDVGFFGGVFRCTEGLYEKYGAHRALDTPITEGGIVAAAIGMGVNGLRPVVEMQFADYIYPAIDQIISELARLRHRSGGEFFAPVTIRAPCGGGIRGGQTHSQSPEGIFTHVCGLKTVMPSNPYDAKGLLISAIEDDDPVMFFEPKRIYNGPFHGHDNNGGGSGSWNDHPLGQVPVGHYRIPLGKAATIRAGRQVTVLAYGTMVHVAAEAIRTSGIDAELLDLRSLLPLDIEAVAESVQKTGRCVVIHEATRTSGYGAELVAEVQETCFWHLRAPIERVTGWDTPYPHAFEWEYFPSQRRIVDALQRTLAYH
ncbi:alpha-ketoacid dehydrogenase subunit beta [Haliea sp. E1-2-M8]|uniref:alpha-ketoacid dehydrogenase subunit beta n=1 Tax=Haliea sp. E1-2-M8 TaxID=3064706 RepID=UPI002722E373|nr:alpha-ketoacid dehydrogenase subunit beta [Haliea sp. E1-2-M8]MDO8863194.1 alpha-ketoacid dehydrogenase subunit beta [Haliea sp. E1-2-M8]